MAYLLAWNMFLAITWWTWAVPLAAGACGVARGARGGLPAGLDRRAAAVVGAVGVGWVFLANQALGPVEDYDFGLYHADLIAYAEKYAAIPGLANLHSRLGAGDAHLLLTAFLDRSPLAGAGPHLVGGLLLALLLLEIGLRLLPARRATLVHAQARSPAGAGHDRPGRGGAAPTHYQPEPRPGGVRRRGGGCPLSRRVRRERVRSGSRPHSDRGARARLGDPAALLALHRVRGCHLHRPGRSAAAPGRSLRAAALVCVLPAALALGWAARQAVLSGYPLFPVTTAGLSADWRVPTAVVVAQNRGDDAWARVPGVDPTTVLASWHWLGSWWLPARERDPDVITPLMLLAAVVTVLAGFGARDPGRRARARPMVAVVAPSMATLGVWFFIAPDPRFVFAPIWLVAAGLVAWALPPLPRPSRRWAFALVGAAALAAAGLALVGVRSPPTRMLPAAIALWAGATALVLVTRRRSAAAPLAHAAVAAAVIAATAVVLHDGGRPPGPCERCRAARPARSRGAGSAGGRDELGPATLPAGDGKRSVLLDHALRAAPDRPGPASARRRRRAGVQCRSRSVIRDSSSARRWARIVFWSASREITVE